MAELQLTQADIAGIAGTGTAGRVTIKDLEISCAHRRTSSGETERDPHRRGRCDAAQLDAAARDRRRWRSRLDPVLEDRQETRSQTWSGALRVARACPCSGGTPNAAARLIGGSAVRSESIDIGVAVEAGEGIMVPVIRNADKTSLGDLTNRYGELVELARKRRVTAEMTAGGIASVSNFGTFGLDWGTPIPLPDQTLLLGMGAGKKAPTWSDEKQQFVPVTQAELTLSFDHRSLDGGGAGRLLKRITELLSEPAKL